MKSPSPKTKYHIDSQPVNITFFSKFVVRPRSTDQRFIDFRSRARDFNSSHSEYMYTLISPRGE